MVKVLYGPIVSDARNKIAGVVATKGHAGSVMRKKVSPIQPRTSAQRGVRANFTGLTKAWAGLGDTVRAAWIAFAGNNPVKDVFGNTLHLTGHQMYVRLNRVLSAANCANISSPPANLTVNYAGPATMTYTAGPPVLIGVTWAHPDNMGGSEKAVILAAPPMSKGRAFIGSKYRQIYVSDLGITGPYPVGGEYVAKFGTPSAGARLNLLALLVKSTNGAQSLGSPCSADT